MCMGINYYIICCLCVFSDGWMVGHDGKRMLDQMNSRSDLLLWKARKYRGGSQDVSHLGTEQIETNWASARWLRHVPSDHGLSLPVVLGSVFTFSYVRNTGQENRQRVELLGYPIFEMIYLFVCFIWYPTFCSLSAAPRHFYSCCEWKSCIHSPNGSMLKKEEEQKSSEHSEVRA